MPTTITTDSRSEEHAALRAAIAATERGDYAAALRAFQVLYGANRPDMLKEGLSYYGLCIERVEKKSKPAIELCQKAMELQPYDMRHRANLIQVYLNLRARRRAVEVLEAGLKHAPDDEVLLAVRERMRYRRPNVISFLSRDHPLNRWLGRLRDRPAAFLAVKVVVGLAVIAAVAGITLMILMR